MDVFGAKTFHIHFGQIGINVFGQIFIVGQFADTVVAGGQ
jgi:hypothetical protein